ncbi:MAG: lipA [Clostridia bacterium]|nr:lipA [Clostridia bacterium]
MEKKPEWLKVLYNKDAVEAIANMMKDLGLNTVCKEANCPNIGECYKKHTATFMILGSRCTRNCSFCNVTCAKPEDIDPEEPMHVAEAVKKLDLRHVVVTSVTRDDLSDGGAEHFAKTIRAIKSVSPNVTVEVLIPDLKGSEAALDTVLDACPDVLNHNVEAVKELYPLVRPQATYERSLGVLSYCKKKAPNMFTKTGFMVGLGETDEQIYTLMDDILATGCDILTIGQYLRPSKEHAELKRYLTPEEFEHYKKIALEKGFKYVASTPLARSSYQAFEALKTVTEGIK